MHYATLHQVRQYLKLDQETVKDDDLLASLVESTKKSIDAYTRKRFDPYHETRNFDYPGKPLDLFGVYDFPVVSGYVTRTKRQLKLDEPLLVLHTLTNGDGTDIAIGDVLQYPSNYYPKHKLKLKVSSDSYWAYGSDGELEQIIGVTGKWGSHSDYGNAWVDSLDTVVDDPLAVGSTSLEVANANGQAADGARDRFQAGNMIRFGSVELGEYAYIRSVDSVSNIATIVRGYNGTTAEEQDLGTGIYIYRPMQNIQLAAIRITVWRYRQKDVDLFDKTYILGTGFAITPTTLPSDVMLLLPSPRQTIRDF